MMKRLLIFLFILCSFQGYSQTITQYLGAANTTIETRGSHKVGGFLYLPGLALGTPTWAGAIRYNAADSSLYYWTGYQWKKPDGSASIDSFTYATRRYVDSSVAANPGGSSLPSQTGNAGKYLTTDGTTASWGTVTAGASSTSDLTDVSDAAPTNNTVLTYNQDSAKYVPTAVAAFNFTDLRDGQYLQYDSLNSEWVNVDAPAGTGTDTSSTATNIRHLTAAPETGNIYFDLTRWQLGLLNPTGTRWLYYAPADSAAVSVPGSGYVDIDFTGSEITESSAGVYTATTGGASWGHTGLSASYLASGNDGSVRQKRQSTDATDAIIGLYVTNSAAGYSFMQCGAWISSDGTVYKVDNGTASSAGFTLAVGSYIRIKRAGSVYSLESSTDGENWTHRFTYTHTSSGNMYVICDINGAGKMYYPQGEGLN